MRTSIRRHGKDERGATIVFVAAAIGTLILVTAFVVDIANWYVHKRHLQVQADAAALAGGAAYTLPGCDDTAIQKAAQQYSGVPNTGLAVATPYNAQLGGTASGNMHMLLNSNGYWPDGGTDFSDGGMPCAASKVDVKMTESNLPWFLRLPLVVPAINAHARVSMRLVSQLKGQLPIGVPDVNPQSGAVIFYDEANPTNLSTTYVRYLHKLGTAGGLNEWANVDSTGSAGTSLAARRRQKFRSEMAPVVARSSRSKTVIRKPPRTHLLLSLPLASADPGGSCRRAPNCERQDDRGGRPGSCRRNSLAPLRRVAFPTAPQQGGVGGRPDACTGTGLKN